MSSAVLLNLLRCSHSAVTRQAAASLQVHFVFVLLQNESKRSLLL